MIVMNCCDSFIQPFGAFVVIKYAITLRIIDKNQFATDIGAGDGKFTVPKPKIADEISVFVKSIVLFWTNSTTTKSYTIVSVFLRRIKIIEFI